VKQFVRTLVAVTLGLTTTALMASPRQLITHNMTDVESNAFVAGTIPSQHPAKAYSDSKVVWTEVRMACFGHTINGKCSALIKMGTGPNDSEIVDLGMVTLDLNTGIITPSTLSANGYTMTVNGPGETTLTKN
jgi:hypothetical protein